MEWKKGNRHFHSSSFNGLKTFIFCNAKNRWAENLSHWLQRFSTPDHDHKGHQKSPMQTPSMQSAMLEEAAIGDSLCNHERCGGKRTDSSKTWVNGIAEIQGETGTSPEVCFHLLVFFLSRVPRERNPSILLKMLSNVPNSRLTLKMWHEEQTAEDFWGSIYNVPTVHIQAPGKTVENWYKDWGPSPEHFTLISCLAVPILPHSMTAGQPGLTRSKFTGAFFKKKI